MKVKIGLIALGIALAGTILIAQDIDPIGSRDPGARPALDPKTADLLKLLHPPAEWRILPVAERLSSKDVIIRVALSEHRLRVFAGDELAVDCPAATGRPGSATPEGEFVIESKIAQPKNLDYGCVRAADGSILVRGTFSRHDPLPAGATFDAQIPKCAFKLSPAGLLMFSGEATGAATTNGAIVIPEKVALLLYDKLEPGVKVVIGR